MKTKHYNISSDTAVMWIRHHEVHERMLLRKITALFINIVSVFAIPQSPCPHYFSYQTGSQGDIIGIVRVPTSLISLPTTLKVELAIRVALKTVSFLFLNSTFDISY